MTPSSAETFIAVLGEDLAAEVFLAEGGAEVWLGNGASVRSRLAERIGVDRLAALAEALGEKVRVPTARPWLAARLERKGLPVAEIARSLHAADTSVRRWLAEAHRPAQVAAADPRQMTLL
jgi:hypothetical protein